MESEYDKTAVKINNILQIFYWRIDNVESQDSSTETFYFNVSSLRIVPGITIIKYLPGIRMPHCSLGLMLFLFIWSVIQVSSDCPAECASNCQTPGQVCNICLQRFYQTYSFDQMTCICIPGFRHFQGTSETCCPNECLTCSQLGCISCHPNAFISINLSPLYLNCSCEQNYVKNINTYQCDCMSQTNPNRYYLDNSTAECFACPEGCTCDPTGCVECDAETNRQIIVTPVNSLACRCLFNYRQVNGVCSCPINCICDGGVVQSCSFGSSRQLILREWTCQFPFQESEGQCVCKSPYTLEGNKCQCGNETDPAPYVVLPVYEYLNVCYKCLGNCRCDFMGCHNCPSTGQYIQTNFSCFCSQNYTRLQDECVCLDPYYLYRQGQCICMSSLNNLDYYFDKVAQICYNCPSGCQCSQNGCFQCQNWTMRIILTDSDGLSRCVCASNSQQNMLGVCKCQPPYIESKQLNGCVCNTDFTRAYFPDSNGQCASCPRGCLCNQLGCVQCSTDALRTIITVNGSFICPCSINTSLDSTGRCLCSANYTFDPSMFTCNCIEPYIMIDGSCYCKSAVQPHLYYWNFIQQICLPCPYGCRCNSLGCQTCTEDSLRYIVTNITSVCPCWQQSQQVNGTCRICTSGYFYGGICVPCYECLTCSRSGCDSCAKGLNLVNNRCVCKNTTLLNWNSTCMCPVSTYGNTKYCVDCPLHCTSCILLYSYLFCTSCLEGANRQMQILTGCECLPGYKEAFPLERYCCLETCASCDSMGCTECYIYSFRVVINHTCYCPDPFVDIGQANCVCPNGTYFYADSCHPCPTRCATCEYTQLTDSLTCLQCFPNSNLNDSSHCQCNKGFIETIPPSTHCTLMFCADQTPVCTQCAYPRVLFGNACQCQDGFYENYFLVCKPCQIAGCTKCLSFDICVQCNTTNGYYLTGDKCTFRNLLLYLYTYSSNHTGVIVQFQVRQEMSALNLVQVNMFEVQEQIVSTKLNSTSEQVHDSFISFGNVITIPFGNPNISYVNVLFSFVISYYQSNSTEAKQVTYTLFHKLVYSDPQLQVFSNTPFSNGVMSYVFIMMTLAGGLYISGFKHNQVVFYMQTLSLFAFCIYNPDLKQQSLLYYLRASYFGFGPGAFQSAIQPYYIQSSPKNYRFLTTDSYFIRVAGVPLTLTLLVTVAMIVFGMVYSVQECCLIKTNKRMFKYTYRFLEFFYKLLMYPMIFFSLQTFFNWNLYVLTDNKLKLVSKLISLCVCVGYSLTTYFQIRKKTIPRSIKVQHISDLVSCFALSSILLGNQSISNNSLLLLAILPLLVRDFIYIFFLRKYFEFVFRSFNWILLPTLLQIVPIVLIVTHQAREVVLIMLVILNLFQIIIPAYVMQSFNTLQLRDKMTVSIDRKKQEDGSASDQLIIIPR